MLSERQHQLIKQCFVLQRCTVICRGLTTGAIPHSSSCVLMLLACLRPASKIKRHVYNIFPLPPYQNPQSFRCLREKSCWLADTIQWNADTFSVGERGSPREGKETPRRNGSASGEAGGWTGGAQEGLWERTRSKGEAWAGGSGGEPLEHMHASPQGAVLPFLCRHSVGHSLVVQWLGLLTFMARSWGSITGRETEIPQAAWHGHKKKSVCYINYTLIKVIIPLRSN